ncbi:TPA: RICH domain-containing protein, partial [Streptococcus pneumoniae]|nr:RICH domain-containing protein [Streptococcus pneumoniae]
MFASKSERKVHYSIRKFSIGVASVVVASLFLGGVVHAEEVRRGNNLTVTSSGDEVESHYQSILEKVRKSLEKDRHTQNVDLIKKLQDIKRTYLYSLKEKPEAELTSKTKKELTAAFEQFKKDTLKSGKKVAEAEKKAKAQKEEDRRNYPTNTYKTIELEIAEAPAPETPKTGWKQENGMWYFYNTDGSMATGWLEYNGSWYYLNANGAMA